MIKNSQLMVGADPNPTSVKKKQQQNLSSSPGNKGFKETTQTMKGKIVKQKSEMRRNIPNITSGFDPDQVSGKLRTINQGLNIMQRTAAKFEEDIDI